MLFDKNTWYNAFVWYESLLIYQDINSYMQWIILLHLVNILGIPRYLSPRYTIWRYCSLVTLMEIINIIDFHVCSYVPYGMLFIGVFEWNFCWNSWILSSCWYKEFMYWIHCITLYLPIIPYQILQLLDSN